MPDAGGMGTDWKRHVLQEEEGKGRRSFEDPAEEFELHIHELSFYAPPSPPKTWTPFRNQGKVENHHRAPMSRFSVHAYVCASCLCRFDAWLDGCVHMLTTTRF